MEQPKLPKKRTIPLLNITIADGEFDAGFKALLAVPEVHSVVMGEIINAIGDGVAHNRKEVSLFRLDHSECAVTIKQAHWSKHLNNALKYYLDKEDYSTCAKARDLIAKIV